MRLGDFTPSRITRIFNGGKSPRQGFLRPVSYVLLACAVAGGLYMGATSPTVKSEIAWAEAHFSHDGHIASLSHEDRADLFLKLEDMGVAGNFLHRDGVSMDQSRLVEAVPKANRDAFYMQLVSQARDEQIASLDKITLHKINTALLRIDLQAGFHDRVSAGEARSRLHAALGGEGVAAVMDLASLNHMARSGEATQMHADAPRVAAGIFAGSFTNPGTDGFAAAKVLFDDFHPRMKADFAAELLRQSSPQILFEGDTVFFNALLDSIVDEVIRKVDSGAPRPFHDKHETALGNVVAYLAGHEDADKLPVMVDRMASAKLEGLPGNIQALLYNTIMDLAIDQPSTETEADYSALSTLMTLPRTDAEMESFMRKTIVKKAYDLEAVQYANMDHAGAGLVLNQLITAYHNSPGKMESELDARIGKFYLNVGLDPDYIAYFEARRAKWHDFLDEKQADLDKVAKAWPKLTVEKKGSILKYLADRHSEIYGMPPAEVKVYNCRDEVETALDKEVCTDHDDSNAFYRGDDEAIYMHLATASSRSFEGAFSTLTHENLHHLQERLRQALIMGRLKPSHPAYDQTRLFHQNKRRYAKSKDHGRKTYQSQPMERHAVFGQKDQKTKRSQYMPKWRSDNIDAAPQPFTGRWQHYTPAKDTHRHHSDPPMDINYPDREKTVPVLTNPEKPSP